MPDLNAIAVFASVVEAKSFSEAARRLKMPSSTVSRRVADLEVELGVRLLERSTHHLRLTPVGAELNVYARQTLQVHEAIHAIVSNQSATVSGKLKLTAPPSISDSMLAPLVTAFRLSHPKVNVEILVTEREVDLIAEDIDLAFHVGPISDTSLIFRKLLTYRHRLVSSRAYLDLFPAPQRPSDLLNHDILAFSHWRPEYRWTFTHVNSLDKETIVFHPKIGMNDFSGLTVALLDGAGIGDLPPIVQPSLVAEGRLVEVMTDWHFPAFDLSIIHHRSRHLARPTRLFKDFASQMVRNLFPDLPT